DVVGGELADSDDFGGFALLLAELTEELRVELEPGRSAGADELARPSGRLRAARIQQCPQRPAGPVSHGDGPHALDEERSGTSPFTAIGQQRRPLLELGVAGRDRTGSRTGSAALVHRTPLALCSLPGVSNPDNTMNRCIAASTASRSSVASRSSSRPRATATPRRACVRASSGV